jgi:mannose-1-phosphate guanylyltransferase
MPLTQSWPKCLMPINGIPLLDIWISDFKRAQIEEVHINTHSHPEIMNEYLGRELFRNFVFNHYEDELLGTARTLLHNHETLSGESFIVAHADNMIDVDIEKFIDFHKYKRPKNCLITMMTFRAESPEKCGVVKLDQAGVVQEFYEKVANPPTNLANGAVYVFEPEVMEWIKDYHPVDISLDLIPNFIGRIAAWENTALHIDIGTVDALKKASELTKKKHNIYDEWLERFRIHPIHSILKDHSS